MSASTETVAKPNQATEAKSEVSSKGPSQTHSKPSNQDQQTNRKDSGKSYRYSKSRRGGGHHSGHDRNYIEKSSNENSGTSGGQSNMEKRKRPDVQPYKPGAFKKSDNKSQPGHTNHEYSDTRDKDASQGAQADNNRKENKFKGRRPPRNQQSHGNETQHISEKVSDLQIEDKEVSSSKDESSVNKRKKKTELSKRNEPEDSEKKESRNEDESKQPGKRNDQQGSKSRRKPKPKQPTSKENVSSKDNAKKDHQDKHPKDQISKYKDKEGQNFSKTDSGRRQFKNEDHKSSSYDTKKQNGFVGDDLSHSSQKFQGSRDHRGKSDRSNQRSRTEENFLPPRLRDQRKDQQYNQYDEYSSNRGRSNRSYHRGGSHSSKGERRHSPERSNVHHEKPISRNHSPIEHEQYHGHKEHHYHRDSTSPRLSQDPRYSHSPTPPHSYSKQQMSNSRRGGYRGSRGGGMRDNSEWNNPRSYGGSDYHNMGGGYYRDERAGMSRGRSQSFKYQHSKPNLPPRLQKQKMREMQQQQNYPYENRRDDFNENASRLWVDEDKDNNRGSHHDLSDNDDDRHKLHSPITTSSTSSYHFEDESKGLADWSAEVEEEERRDRRQTSLELSEKDIANIPHKPGGGGLIRLPSNYNTSRDHWSNRTYPSDNPDWRSGQSRHVESGRNSHESGRILFDPRNPNRPLPTHHQGHHRPQSGYHQKSHEMMQRHPYEPAKPQMMMHQPQRGHFFPVWYDVNHELFYEFKSLDKNLILAIAQSDDSLRRIYFNEHGVENLCNYWDYEVYKHRKIIKENVEQLIKTNMRFCAKNDVEFHVWNIAFYFLVERLRGGLQNEEMRSVVLKNISQLIEEGISFYEHILEVLKNTYRINLDLYYDILEPRPGDAYSACVLMSAQKCLLCLGDLSRYKEEIYDTNNFGKARRYYLKASHIDPRNPKPFNQLAILALITKRKFEAVYYNMRCLKTKQPIDRTHQNLLILFEEYKKKWDSLEKKRLEERERIKKVEEREKEDLIINKGARLRKEIWIRPDGGKRLHRTTSVADSNEDPQMQEIHSMSTSDLNRRFNNTFLYLIGKLFSNINIETFKIALELLQKEFKVLVSRSPLPIDSKRLVQIMALNMFIIDHTKLSKVKGDSSKNDYRSATQDAALQLAFEMFGILVERCNAILKSVIHQIHPDNNHFIFPDDDLQTLLASVKVWCDWILGNSDTWYPVVCEEPFTQLAQLATYLERLMPHVQPALSQLIKVGDYEKLHNKHDYDLVKLDEDSMLCGFELWFSGLDWEAYRRYVHKSVHYGIAQDARRIDAINLCIHFLEGLDNPVLKWSPPDNAHISLVKGLNSSRESETDLSSILASNKDIIDESYSSDENSDPSPIPEEITNATSSNVSNLKLRKEELLRQQVKEEKESKRRKRQILSEHVHMTLEVKPKYIIPDTNCFVDYIEQIRELASCKNYQLRVPLIVLNELEGLAKGARPSQHANKSHAVHVKENAANALNYLRERPANIKCITSKGTIITSMMVTTEQDAEGKKNDDLILDSCLSIADQYSNRFPPSEGVDERGNPIRYVYRDVVLLTDDKNLKLKAHVADIPVNKFNDFISWAFEK